MPYLTTTGLTLNTVMATDKDQPTAGSVAAGALETTGIPVDLPTTTYRTLYRVVLGAVSPGDVLDITGEARVTNDVGYTVGVGWHLWIYDYNNSLKTNGPWWRISPLMGDNVDTAVRHHMPLHISTLHRMPDDWPDGHRPVVVLRADAHSTAWQAGDTLTVDAGYGQLIVRHWTTPPEV